MNFQLDSLKRNFVDTSFCITDPKDQKLAFSSFHGGSITDKVVEGIDDILMLIEDSKAQVAPPGNLDHEPCSELISH